MTTENTDYMTAPLIQEKTGIKASTIKRMRLDGKLKNVLQKGRKTFLYSYSEILSTYKQPQEQAA